jgi:hypothetical protein
LDFFKKKAGFSKLAECSPRHLSAYQKGMTIAFERHHDRLLDFPSLDAFFLVLEEPFDFTAFIGARIDWWRKLADLWEAPSARGCAIARHLVWFGRNAPRSRPVWRSGRGGTSDPSKL